jgi:hypothetical protein
LFAGVAEKNDQPPSDNANLLHTREAEENNAVHLYLKHRWLMRWQARRAPRPRRRLARIMKSKAATP